MSENPPGFNMHEAVIDPNAKVRLSTIAGRFRSVVCAVLFLGISKNYMDRQPLGVFKVTLQHDPHWSEIEYSNLVFATQAAYAVGTLLMGHFIDRVFTLTCHPRQSMSLLGEVFSVNLPVRMCH